jgi:hypothetical protein
MPRCAGSKYRWVGAQLSDSQTHHHFAIGLWQTPKQICQEPTEGLQKTSRFGSLVPARESLYINTACIKDKADNKLKKPLLPFGFFPIAA